MGSRLARDDRRRGGRTVVVHVSTDGRIHTGAKMALLVAPPDAEDVPEGGQVASEAPPRGTRPIGGVGDAIEDIGCETIVCSDAMHASAAAQPALPGLGGRAETSPGTLPTVVILRAVRVTLEARWASAAATAAAMAAARLGGGGPGRG